MHIAMSFFSQLFHTALIIFLTPGLGKNQTALRAKTLRVTCLNINILCAQTARIITRGVLTPGNPETSRQ